MEIRKAPKRLVRMACAAAFLAALGLVTLLFTGQAAPPTPRQGAELRFMGSEVDYNVQVENITASNLKLQTNYKLRKPQGQPPQKQALKDLDFVDSPPNLASEDYTPDDGLGSLPKPQKSSTGSPKKYTPVPPPNPQVYILPTEDVRLVFPDDDENEMAAGIRAVDEELGRPSDLHAIILESGEDADSFSRALHEYQSRNYHSRTEPDEPYPSQVTHQHPQPHHQLQPQSHHQPLYSSPHQQLAHQALQQPSPWELLPQQQLQHLKQYPQPYQPIPEMVLRPSAKTRRSSRVRRSAALPEEGVMFPALRRQKREVDEGSEEEYDSDEFDSDEQPPKIKTKKPDTVRPMDSFESDEVRRPPAPKPSKVSTTPKTNMTPNKSKSPPQPKTTKKPALVVTTKKPVKATTAKLIPPKISSLPATTSTMDDAVVTEADPTSGTALPTEPVTSVEDLMTTFSEFATATDNPEATVVTVPDAKFLASEESFENSVEDPLSKESSVEYSSELPGSFEDNSSERPDSSELDDYDYSKSIEDSSEYPDSVEKSSEFPKSLEESLENSSEYPDSSENYIDSTEAQSKENNDSVEKGSMESTERASMESMKGESLESTEKTSMESTDKASIESMEKSSLESTEKTSIESTDKASIESMEKSSLESTEKTSLESTEKNSIESIEKSSLESTEKGSIESTERTSLESMEGSSLESTEKTSIESTEKGSFESTEKGSIESTEKFSMESTEKTSIENTEEASFESTEKGSMESSEKTSIESIELIGLESMEEIRLETTERTSLENTEDPSISIPSKDTNSTLRVNPRNAPETRFRIETNELDDLKSYLSLENDIDYTESSVER